MGMAERIKTTVFPVTYRLFLHFLIYIFVVVLSISLRDIDSIFEMPLLITISSAFFLLEKSATHLQDPFMNRPTDTAMTTISRTIEINIKQLLGEKEIPEPIKPEKFYAL
jgi:putative membrane protein